MYKYIISILYNCINRYIINGNLLSIAYSRCQEIVLGGTEAALPLLQKPAASEVPVPTGRAERFERQLLLEEEQALRAQEGSGFSLF